MELRCVTRRTRRGSAQGVRCVLIKPLDHRWSTGPDATSTSLVCRITTTTARTKIWQVGTFLGKRPAHEFICTSRCLEESSRERGNQMQFIVDIIVCTIGKRPSPSPPSSRLASTTS